MKNKTFYGMKFGSVASLLLTLSIYSSVAYSGNSCEKFAAWVKPLQAFAKEDRQGKLKLPPIRKASEAFVQYRLLFEDERFVPYFGEPFDSINWFSRSRINRALQYAGNNCGKRDETDIKFYVSLSPGVYLSEPFSKRASRGPDMSYETIVAHVQQVRSTAGSSVIRRQSSKVNSASQMGDAATNNVKIAKADSSSAKANNQVKHQNGDKPSSSKRQHKENLVKKDVQTVDPTLPSESNECIAAEILDPLNFEPGNKIKPPKPAPDLPIGSAAVLKCKKAYEKAPTIEASYRVARALHLYIRQNPNRNKTAVNKADLLKHLTPAVEARHAKALYFAGVLRNSGYFDNKEMNCLRGFAAYKCFKYAVDAGYKDARWPKVLTDMNSGHNSIDYLVELSDEGFLPAMRMLFDYRNDVKLRWRRTSLADIDWIGEESYDKNKNSYLNHHKEDLWLLTQALFEKGETRSAYDAAEMAIIDNRADVSNDQLKELLTAAFDKSYGMAEALAAVAQQGGILPENALGNVQALYQQAESQGNPFASIVLARRQYAMREGVPVNTQQALKKLIEIKEMAGKYVPKDADVMWAKERGYWSRLTYSQLSPLLGPLAFREATRLVQENEGKEAPPRAIELYRIASSSGVQRAHLALAFLYKHGNGLPKSMDYASSFFFIARNCTPKQNPGLMDCDRDLRDQAMIEEKRTDDIRFGDQYSTSSRELLALLGLGLFLLGNSDGPGDYQPESATWKQPDMNMAEMLEWVK